MIEHHGFEMSPKEFEAAKAWPKARGRGSDWRGAYASQSPLNAMYVTHEGGGAGGSKGYLALPGAHADQFYAEATPFWERPRRTPDLRDTRMTLYLKAVSPIRVSPGYKPYIFIDDHDIKRNTFCGWYVKKPLKVGRDWTLNTVDLRNDERLWVCYANRPPHAEDRPLDRVLSNVGFIGVMYLKGKEFTGVNACGVLGIDELRFNIPLSKRANA